MSEEKEYIERGAVNAAIYELNGLLDGYLCAGDVTDQDEFVIAIRKAIWCLEKEGERKKLKTLTCEGCYRESDNRAGFFKIACSRCIRNKNEYLSDFYSIETDKYQEPSIDFISRRALVEKFEKLKDGANLRDNLYLCGVQAAIETFPAADVEPVVRGEWQKIYENTTFGAMYRCSICGETTFNVENYKYCPKCGAHMERSGSGE